jgi:hypothetical protein
VAAAGGGWRRAAFDARLLGHGLWLAALDNRWCTAVLVCMMLVGYPAGLAIIVMMCHWLLGTQW